jgi:hypothetical protein
MAETPVTLKISGYKEREVAMVSYSFNRAIDKENQPAGIPRGGLIKLRVKAHNEGTDELLQWMLTPDKHLDGSIEFKQAKDVAKKMKQINFKHAYCVSFEETWNDVSTGSTDLAHYEDITISCQFLDNDASGIAFTNEWK